MGYRVKGAFKKYRNKVIVALILWLVLTMVFVSPVSIAIKDAVEAGGFDFAIFCTSLGREIVNPFKALFGCFSANYIGMFWSVFSKFSLVYAICMAIGIIQSVPRNEYEDIEHGSSDWCEHGEQYKVLSQDKGIILAQNNCLPVDKRGNVNVLVVGGSGSRKIYIICYT